MQQLDLATSQAHSKKFEPQKWLMRYHWSGALLAYTVISLLITYPLIFRLNDYAPGGYFKGDASYNAWAIWWFKQALESGQNPVYTDQIYGLVAPVQIFVISYFDNVVAFVLQLFLSPLAAYSLIILLGFVFSGFTMYLLAGEFLGSKLSCFAAGFFFDFSTFHFYRATGHMERATLLWLPFFVWRIFRFYRCPNLLNAFLAGLGLALCGLTDLYFLGYFVLPFGVLFITGKLLTNLKWFKQPRHLGLGILALAVALVLLLPALLQYTKVDPDSKAAFEFAARFSTKVFRLICWPMCYHRFLTPCLVRLPLRFLAKSNMWAKK